MAKFPALVLFAIIFPLSGFAQEAIQSETNGYIQVNIEYVSMFPGYLQVKDEICRRPRSFECEKNSITLQSERCRRNPTSKKCEEARQLSESPSCMEGLIFNGRVSPGEKTQASICRSYAGYGNVSIRDLSKGGIWTNYSLTNNGDTLRYP